MKCFPIELARYFEYCGVGPEEEWRLALYCVSVGSPAVNDFVRHHRIHCLAVNWLGMQKRRKANCNGEEDYPKRDEANRRHRGKMSWATVIRHQNLTAGVKHEHLPQSRFSGKPDDAIRTDLVRKPVVRSGFGRGTCKSDK